MSVKRRDGRKPAPTPRRRRLTDGLPVIRGRACGECGACCFALRVTGHNPQGWDGPSKADYSSCRCSTLSGCAIYETRPSGCRGYRCLWLIGDPKLDRDLDRPDRLGVIFDIAGGRIHVRELVEGAASSERVRGLIGRYRGGGLSVVVIPHDNRRRVLKAPLALTVERKALP
jgi:hypothetical protein